MASDFETRLRKLEDERDIYHLAALFSDTINERNLDAFLALWTPDAVWEIGPPLHNKAVGVEAIGQLLHRLLDPWTVFVQLTHSGVIEFESTYIARARFAEREHAKGGEKYYENLAIYRDEFVRTEDGWRFKSRYYEYRFLDNTAFSGVAIARNAPTRPLP